MDYTIRKMRTDEYHLLDDFLYQAIYQPDTTNLAPKSIINKPELQVYIKDFGKQKDDYCFCAEVDNRVVGAVWVRNINGCGNIDNGTVEFAISVFDEYQNMGIGTALMKKMLEHLKELNYQKASLAVQKENYAVRMYQKVGFEIACENEQEFIMIHRLGNENMQITLDKWKAENYIDFYEASNDDELRNNMNDDFPKSLNECKKIVSFFANSTDTTECVRAIKADGEIIGCIAAFFRTEMNFKTAELAYWISKKYRGHGIMTKVITDYTEMLFSDFEINKVFAKPFAHNVASQKVLLKAGFKPADENGQEYIMIHRLGNENDK